jgi:hypothetical protein
VPASSPNPPRRASRPADGDAPTLPDRAEDDRDLGWGDDPAAGERDDDWYVRERPPHHE